jgi:multidrug efflux pump subunit AcrA (membrane-fusion protein)
MELLSQQQAQAMVIPSAALQQSQNQYQYWLWLAKDGKAIRQNISIGQRAADKVQVISGLANDSQIIVSDKPLQAGQKISIHAPAPKGQ